ncbi:MAG TPA: efflux RND transporter periplasmic adaptor subunit [Burkholderiales bacterium]|nr:efflux RND transporter periplasmic adaptor subunit [Burkholderiales bacterium]
MNRGAAAAVAWVVALAAGAAGGYWFASHRAHPVTAAPKTSEAATTDKKVLYWYDPMYPQHRFDKPGKSPFMDMQLVPRYAGETEDQGAVTVSPRVAQSLGIRTAEVKRGSMAPKLSAVGTVEYNERSVVLVQPRANGFIERLYVRAPLDPVRQGAPLVEMLIPEWAAAQEEYLLLRKRADNGSGELATAARQRLLLLGMSESQVAAIERSGTPQPRITLASPISGVVAELGARQGMTVTAGTTLFRIAGLGTVWVVAEVPETQAGQLVPGSRVEVHLAAYPNEVVKGRVSAVLPEINAATRTVRLRVEVANAAGRLRPGMYANVSFAPRAQELLLVPTEAVIRTGERTVVIVAENEGRFRVAEIEPGMESGAETEIRKGLKAGERVVVSGQFLIDSEASLRSTLSRLESSPVPAKQTDAKPEGHRGHGRITAIDPAKGRIDLDHAAIPSMKWPAMHMGFAVADRGALDTLKPGDTVDFTVRANPDKNGDYVIESLSARSAK